MKNMFDSIMQMTFVERKFDGQYKDLLSDVWDLIGNDFDENVEVINQVIKDHNVLAIETLSYEFTCKQMIKYHEFDMYGYNLTYNEYLANNWEEYDDRSLVQFTVYDIIKRFIKPIVDEVINTPLPENNDIINDLEMGGK